MILVGDFHLDVPSHPVTTNFLAILNQYDLIQHITSPTHTKGHILDVVCSRIADRALLDVEQVDPGLSDQLAVCFRVNVRKPVPTKKTITYRNLRNINIADFTGDLRRRLDGYTVSVDDLDAAVDDLDAAVCRLDTAL